MTDITESQEIEESEGVILQPSFIEPLQTMIANKPQAEQERIVGQFCLAIYAKINNQRMPEFTSDYSKMAYLMAEYTIISCSKKFKENRKKGIASGKARRAKKEAKQAEQALAEINSKNIEQDGKTVDNKGFSSGHSTNQALGQIKAENIEKNDKSLDNKGFSSGQTKEQPITNSDKSKEQTVSSSHQLQKTQQPQKRQPLQKEQQSL